MVPVGILAVILIIYGAWKRGAFLPGWIVWEEKSEETEIGTLELKDRKLTITDQGTVVFRAPEEVLVQDALWCDIDHDTQKECLILCWKIGRYGESRPFWVEKDEKKWSQHIYIYHLDQEGILKPSWMASDIGLDVRTMAFTEADRLILTEPGGKKTSWDWISWGLTFRKEIRE